MFQHTGSFYFSLNLNIVPVLLETKLIWSMEKTLPFASVQLHFKKTHQPPQQLHDNCVFCLVVLSNTINLTGSKIS